MTEDFKNGMIIGYERAVRDVLDIIDEEYTTHNEEVKKGVARAGITLDRVRKRVMNSFISIGEQE